MAYVDGHTWWWKILYMAFIEASFKLSLTYGGDIEYGDFTWIIANENI